METLLLAAPLVLYASFALVERLVQARRYPAMKGWKIRGVINFALLIALSTFAPVYWLPTVMEHAPMDATGWPLAVQVIVGFVAYQLAFYAYHRTAHRVHAMWRWFHQVHHSAERLDTHSAFMFHPSEILVFAFLQTTIPLGVLGLSVEATGAIGLIGLFYSVFQHANIHTPAWLGYVIQRPEQHALHHQRSVHAWNYADLPLVDLVFGTFRNPRRVEAEAGFWDGASERVGAMFIGRDVTEPAPAAAVAREGTRSLA